LIYKLMASDGTLFGHRFDICEGVRISSNKIRWTDLALDLWVGLDNKIYVLDEEDVEMRKARRLLSAKQLAIIEQTKEYLLKNYKRIIASLETSAAAPR